MGYHSAAEENEEGTINLEQVIASGHSIWVWGVVEDDDDTKSKAVSTNGNFL